MPPNLADLANGMSTSSAISAFMSNGTLPSGGLGIGYICSFSLPAISICAMLSLSIILSLLEHLSRLDGLGEDLSSDPGEEVALMSGSLFVGWPLDVPDSGGSLDYSADYAMPA